MFKSRFSIALCMVLGLGITQQVCASQKDIDAEMNYFVTVFGGDNLQVMKGAAQNLQNKGYSNEVIFDLVAKQVKEHEQNVVTRNDIDAVAWMVRALGFSGNEKYLPALKDIMENGDVKLKRYASLAIEDLVAMCVGMP